VQHFTYVCYTAKQSWDGCMVWAATGCASCHFPFGPSCPGRLHCMRHAFACYCCSRSLLAMGAQACFLCSPLLNHFLLAVYNCRRVMYHPFPVARRGADRHCSLELLAGAWRERLLAPAAVACLHLCVSQRLYLSVLKTV